MRQRLRGWAGTGHRATLPALLVISALALACIFQAIRLFYIVITPVGPVGNWRPQQAAILSVPERIALFERLDPFYRNAAPANAGPGAVTSLPLQLFGTRINEGSGGGSAIIAGADGVQLSIGVGEDIQSGVRLTAVYFDHVEIDNGGKKELLYIDQSQGQPAASATPGVPATPVPVPPGSPANAPLPPPPALPVPPPQTTPRPSAASTHIFDDSAPRRRATASLSPQHAPLHRAGDSGRTTLPLAARIAVGSS